MATLVREVLNADGMRLTIFTGGTSTTGLNLSGTWVGTVSFLASTDGVNFKPVPMTPFASGTAVTSATTTGNWFAPSQNYLAFQVLFTRTSGSVIVTFGTAVDSSYQDAFLASTSKYVNQAATGATNTLTIAASTNRAWRLRTLMVSVSATATWAANPVVKVTDGASAVIWACDLPTTAGLNSIILPADTPFNPGGGVVNTPGNSLVITIASGAGSVITNANAEILAA